MVLFTSTRPLERAENLKAVYDAYDGEKEYVQTHPNTPIPNLHKYELQVGDELPVEAAKKFIWIGHGMGAGKAYGIQRKWFHHTELITYAIASSVDMIPYVAKFTGLDRSKIIPLGMPRTDAYFKGVKPTKNLFLYAPTFRGNRWWIPNWNSIDIKEDETLVVKPHMVTGKIMDHDRGNIVEYDSMIPSTDILTRSEVLITDFSSIMFDAFVMRKPVVLFAKDRYQYLRNRPMYCIYPNDYSQYFCDAEEFLMDTVRRAEWNANSEKLRKFYVDACDGRSTERCIELIRSVL